MLETELLHAHPMRVGAPGLEFTIYGESAWPVFLVVPSYFLIRNKTQDIFLIVFTDMKNSWIFIEELLYTLFWHQYFFIFLGIG